MQAIYNAASTPKVIDENGSLTQFYNLTDVLSKTRYVRFIDKVDEADNIEWNFKYRGYPLSLNYSIYSGVTITPQNSTEKDAKAVMELVGKLKSKTAHQ